MKLNAFYTRCMFIFIFTWMLFINMATATKLFILELSVSLIGLVFCIMLSVILYIRRRDSFYQTIPGERFLVFYLSSIVSLVTLVSLSGVIPITYHAAFHLETSATGDRVEHIIIFLFNMLLCLISWSCLMSGYHHFSCCKINATQWNLFLRARIYASFVVLAALVVLSLWKKENWPTVTVGFLFYMMIRAYWIKKTIILDSYVEEDGQQPNDQSDSSSQQSIKTSQSEPPSLPIDINTAAKSALVSLPSIHLADAERIIERRAQTVFRTLDELITYLDFSQHEYANLTNKVTFSSAGEDEKTLTDFQDYSSRHGRIID